MNKLRKLLNDPKMLILYLMNKGFFNFLSDKLYLKLEYKLIMNKKLNLNNPQTFNEKLQWLKLYDRKDIYTIMVDKYEVKKYVASIIGEKYIIPTLGVYEKFDDIDFDKLPNQFVIKCTHDSGGLIIVKDKSKLNIKVARKKINKFLKRKYYYVHREWPYKNVKPRIIIEKYMEDNKTKNIIDYKFFCFNGISKLMYTSCNSHYENQSIAFFDMNYKYLDIRREDYNDFIKLPSEPKNFEVMKKLANILSKNISHVRVDFYEINKKVYFGEFTFHSGSGFIPFKKVGDDLKLGKLINISKVNVDEK